MDEKQLQDLKNEFIHLIEAGKDLEAIKNELKVVDPRTINGWALEYHNSKTPSSPILIVDGKIKLTPLETIKYQLGLIANATHPFLTELKIPALTHYETLNKFVQKITIKQSNEYGSFSHKYAIEFKVQQTDLETKTKINKAIEFYNEYVVKTRLRDESLMQKPSKNLTQFTNSQPLDYCIKQIAIKNYQGIQELHLKDLPIDAQWIFITGENGYGKTTLLQAIVIALYGFKDGNLILMDNEQCEIGIEFLDNGKNEINNLNKVFKRFTNFAAYGPVRLNRTSPNENTIHEKSTPTYNLFHSDGLLLNIDYELKKWYWKKDKRYDQVRTLFMELIPMLQDIYFEDKEGQEEILYVEADEAGTPYPPLPFRKLASGYRSIISMVGDMLVRLSRQQPEVENIRELGGIIIIDEIDIHFHPKWQRNLPSILSNAFPKVQFIVSTHSLVPLLGAPKNALFFKLNRTKETGITAQRIDIDIANLLPNSLLSSPLFDMENITSINNTSIADLRYEDNYQTILENDERKQLLKEFQENNPDFPDDLFNTDNN